MLSAYEERLAQQRPARPRWMFPTAIALSLLGAVALAFGLAAAQRAQRARQSMSADYISLRQGIARDFQLLEERIAHGEENNAQLQGQVSVVAERLQLSPDEREQARQIAAQIHQLNAPQLAALRAGLRKELETKAGTDEVDAARAGFSREISAARSDLSTARTGLQATLDEVSKQVARNHEEIERLRQIGQRDYHDFLLNGKGTRKTMGDVTVELRGVNAKKNLFSVALYFDQQRLEKRNRALHEPIFFYTRDANAPLELVVNQLGANHVAGYLSAPKANALAASTQSRPSP